MTLSHQSSPMSGRDPLPASSRYECLAKVASGGMATVYVGRLRGKHGFSRLVAIKRAHPHLLDDEALRRGLISEARLAAQIHDPHVVSVLDVDEAGGELMLIMDYIEGGSLSQLLAIAGKRGDRLSPGVVTRILLDSCLGLAAAHELNDESGVPLAIVHRDVSPHNILVGVDGLSRIADFGIAKWAEATQATSAGLKGKFSYMAPEYIRTRKLDLRADVFAMGVVAWEAFTGQRLFRGDGELETIQQVVDTAARPMSAVDAGVPAAFDAPVARALEKDPDARFASAREFARALEAAAESAGIDTSVGPVGACVRHLLGDVLDARRTVLRDLGGGSTESGKGSSVSSRSPSPPGSGPANFAEGIQTATATLDAAFATDARTLPIERPPASTRRDAPEEASPSVEPRPGRSLRGSLAVVAATAVGVVATALLWPSRSPSPAAGPTAPSSAAATASAPEPTVPVAEESAPTGEVTGGATTSAAASAPSSVHLRKPARRIEASAQSGTSPASARTAAPAPSAPARPGLGY